MKKILILGLVIITANQIIGQEKIKKNSIKVNVVGAISGLYELKYERAINSKNSIEFSVGTGLLRKRNKSADRIFENELETDFFNGRDNEYKLEVFETATLAYRYYFGQNNFLNGFYVSPGIQFLDLRERYTSNNNTIIGESIYILFNFNGKLGYQFNWKKTIQLNPFIGFSQSIKSADPYDARGVSVERYGAGLNLLYGFDLGFRF